METRLGPPASPVVEMEAVAEHTLWGPLTPRTAQGGL